MTKTISDAALRLINDIALVDSDLAAKIKPSIDLFAESFDSSNMNSDEIFKSLEEYFKLTDQTQKEKWWKEHKDVTDKVTELFKNIKSESVSESTEKDDKKDADQCEISGVANGATYTFGLPEDEFKDGAMTSPAKPEKKDDKKKEPAKDFDPNKAPKPEDQNEKDGLTDDEVKPVRLDNDQVSPKDYADAEKAKNKPDENPYVESMRKMYRRHVVEESQDIDDLKITTYPYVVFEWRVQLEGDWKPVKAIYKYFDKNVNPETEAIKIAKSKGWAGVSVGFLKPVDPGHKFSQAIVKLIKLVSESKEVVEESKYICWRSNPQFSSGGYITVRDKKPGEPIYGGINVIAKLKDSDYSRLFPNGVSRLTLDDVEHILKQEKMESEDATWSDIIGENAATTLATAFGKLKDNLVKDDDVEFSESLSNEFAGKTKRGSSTNSNSKEELAEFLEDYAAAMESLGVDSFKDGDDTIDAVDDGLASIKSIIKEISK